MFCRFSSITPASPSALRRRRFDGRRVRLPARDCDPRSFFLLFITHSFCLTYSNCYDCTYKIVRKMFLQEHCGKLLALPRNLFSCKYFRYLLVHEGKRLLRHRILPYRCERLPMQRCGAKFTQGSQVLWGTVALMRSQS